MVTSERVDRDPRTGQFLPGHASQRTHTRLELNRLLRQCVKPEHVAEIYASLWKDCFDEDPKVRLPSRELWLDRMLGKATERIEIDSQHTDLTSISTAQLIAELARMTSIDAKASPVVQDAPRLHAPTQDTIDQPNAPEAILKPFRDDSQNLL